MDIMRSKWIKWLNWEVYEKSGGERMVWKGGLGCDIA